MLRAALDVSRRQLWDLQARFQDIGEDGASILVTQGLRTELADRERQIERLQRERARVELTMAELGRRAEAGEARVEFLESELGEVRGSATPRPDWTRGRLF